MFGRPESQEKEMINKQILDLLKQYVDRAAPKADEVAPFVYMGFVWIHNDSFRQWLGTEHGIWIGQKSVARIFKSQGWQVRQGVKTVPVNLWAIPLKELEHGKQHQGA